MENTLKRAEKLDQTAIVLVFERIASASPRCFNALSRKTDEQIALGYT